MKRHKILQCAAAATIAGTVLVSCGSSVDSWEQVTVTNKERTCFKSNDCRYMVYTDKENFEITDQWNGRKNSSDVYGKIQVNKTYRFHVNGYRDPSRTKFRNILETNEVTTLPGVTITSR
jgi:hypothetical protein